MSKILTLSNGKSFEFEDSSSIYTLMATYDDFSAIDSVYPELTTDNLIGATFDGVVYTDAIPSGIQVTVDKDQKVHVIFYNRQKTTEEIMQEQITELQEALAEIAG